MSMMLAWHAAALDTAAKEWTLNSRNTEVRVGGMKLVSILMPHS